MNSRQHPGEIIKHTIQVTFFSFFGVLVGFASQLVIAYYFGATTQRDAYFAAMTIPTYISAIFVSSLGFVFMPFFIKTKIERNTEETWKFASNTINLSFLFLFSVSMLGVIFSKQILRITAPGFTGGQLAYTSELLSILFPTIIFQCLASIISSTYQAEHKFLLPAAVPIISAIFALLFVIFFSNAIGIRSLAYGTLGGSIFSFLCLFFGIIRNRKYSLRLNLKNPEFTKLLKVALPLFLGGIIYKSTDVFEKMIASGLPAGSISYLGYANQIMFVLSGVSSSGIATTIFPIMSTAWSENNLRKVRSYFSRGIITILLITIPLSVIFIMFGVPILQTILERGAFNHQTTIAVSRAFSILTLAFICNSLGNITGKIFYFSQKTKLAAALGVLGTLFYVGPALLLAHYYSYLGIAIASSGSTLLNVLIAAFAIKFIIKGINGSKIMSGLLRILAASLIAAAFAYLIYRVGLKYEITLTTLAILAYLISFSFCVFFIFKIEEAVLFFNELKNYIAKKIGRPPIVKTEQR
jgi:putative peptidoglycan lipid II flippase